MEICVDCMRKTDLTLVSLYFRVVTLPLLKFGLLLNFYF
jgi:hypothetical protein